MALLISTVIHGLETDQYYAWGRALSDSAEVINAKFNLELELAASDVNARHSKGPQSCQAVIRQFRTQVHFTTFQEIELWALNTEMLSRVPSDSEEEMEYRQTNLYHQHGALDVGTWLPTVPTIEVNGIRFGTDKIAHFVSSGWRWHQAYVDALDDGLSPDEAELKVINQGLFWERTMLGGVASGVTSLGDLEANFQGMRFYYGLCHGPDAGLVLKRETWVIRRPFDIREYVSAEWDESYNNPIFAEHRWKNVEPVLKTYCDRLGLPSVQEQRRRYQLNDTTTPLESVIADLVASGDLSNPERFSISRACPHISVPEPLPSVAPPPHTVATEATAPDPALIREIHRSETDLQRRTVGLAAVNLTNPERIAVSAGLLFTKIPVSYACTTACSFQGPMIQLGAGLGGGRLSAGWGRVIGEQNGAGMMITSHHIGLGFKGTLLYTWGDPYHEPPGAAFLGGEVEFTIVRVNFRAGAFYHVGGAQSKQPWLLSGGIGWGF